MENQTLQELPPQGGPSQLQPSPQSGNLPPGLPQLPPQMFTTAAQLLDLTDKKLLLVLRDGRKLIGVLRSWDQFANLVLQDTIERIYVDELYADIPRGIFLVRGENVLMLGEIDLDKDDHVPEPFKKATPQEVHALSKRKTHDRKQFEKLRAKKLGAQGFDTEGIGEILY